MGYSLKSQHLESQMMARNQISLTIDQLGDRNEQEADRVAQKALRTPEPGTEIMAGYGFSQVRMRLQRAIQAHLHKMKGPNP
jgi:hypothetical protein